MKSKRKWLALVLSVVFLASLTAQSASAFLIHRSKPIINQFLPMEYAVNDIVISKEVEHPFGDRYTIPSTLSFDYEVNLGPFYAGKTVTTTDGEKTADGNGVITVSVKPGASVEIKGIDEGTVVTVTELQNRPGFEPKDGNARQTVTVSAEEASTVEFVNVYTPDPVQANNVNVGGIKILEGRDWQEGDVFKFLLEAENGENEWNELDTQSVVYDYEDQTFNTFDFNEVVQDLVFDKIGYYNFCISEIKGDLPNMDYDENVNNFMITVSDDDMDGKLEIGKVDAWQNATATETDAGFDVSVTFNNTFKPLPVPEDVTVPITIQKTVQNVGETEIGPEGFEFLLKNLDNSNTMTVTSNLSGTTSVDFTFTADDAGKSFWFELSEIDGGMEGVTYSDEIYKIEIRVNLNEENELAAEVLCNGIETVNMTAKFVNIYNDGTVITEIPTETVTTEPPTTTEGPQQSTPTGEGPNYAPYILLIAIGAAALFVVIIKRRETV